jgi:hypothetical protein
LDADIRGYAVLVDAKGLGKMLGLEKHAARRWAAKNLEPVLLSTKAVRWRIADVLEAIGGVKAVASAPEPSDKMP